MRRLSLLLLVAIACGGERNQAEGKPDCATPEKIVVCGENEWAEFIAPSASACIRVDGKATLWLDVVPHACSPGQGPVLVDGAYTTTSRSLYFQGDACVTFPLNCE